MLNRGGRVWGRALAAAFLLSMPLVGCECDEVETRTIRCDFTVSAPAGTSIDFGRAFIGERATQTVVLENHGTTRLDAFTVKNDGRGAPHFTLDAFESVSVPAGGRVDVVVAFEPQGASPALATTVQIGHRAVQGASCPTVALSLRGQGVRVTPPRDGGPNDAGSSDAGVLDAGADAGPMLDGGAADAGPMLDAGPEPPPFDAYFEARLGMDGPRALAALVRVDDVAWSVGGIDAFGAAHQSIARTTLPALTPEAAVALAVPRVQPGAAVLADGRVAVVGGRSGGANPAALDSVELVAPAGMTGACITADCGATLATARMRPAVLAMDDGSLGVLGGTDAAGMPAAGAERVALDGTATPWAGAPAGIARADDARAVDAAVCLWLAGGTDGAGLRLRSVVRACPDGTIDVWPTALPVGLSGASAAGTADGVVLVGGTADTGPHGATVISAQGTARALAAPAVFGEWPAAAALPEDRVLVAGGFAPGVREAQSAAGLPGQRSAWVLDLRTGTVAATENALAVAHERGTALRHGDDVVLLGGLHTRPRLTAHGDAERFTPAPRTAPDQDDAGAVGSWSVAGIGGPGAALVDTGAHVVSYGGAGPHMDGAPRALARDGTAVHALPAPAHNASDAMLHALGPDSVLVMGGALGGNASDVVGTWTPSDGSWTAVTTLTAPRTGATVTALDAPAGTLLVCGGRGQDGAQLASCDVVDTTADPIAVRAGPDPIVARAGHVALAVPGGAWLIGGGAGPNPAVSERVTPNTTTVGARPRVARAMIAAATLPSGDTILAGGRSAVGAPLVTATVVRAAGMLDATHDLGRPRAGAMAFAGVNGAVIAGGATPGPRAERPEYALHTAEWLAPEAARSRVVEAFALPRPRADGRAVPAAAHLVLGGHAATGGPGEAHALVYAVDAWVVP